MRQTRTAGYSILLGTIFTGTILAILALASVAAWGPPAWMESLVWERGYAGDSNSVLQCNVCGRHLKRWAQDIRNEETCPFCMARPRHRTAYQWLRERSDLFDGRPKRMLHFAPEASLGAIFQKLPRIDYLSADLDPKAAMVQMDITDIRFGDNTFDVIYCSHVLEHVPDDRKAMRELARVLKPTGWAVIAVPVLRQDKTYEDLSITTPEGRMKAFGQEDHVRAYGPDFIDRLRESGFQVTAESFGEQLGEPVVRRYGLSRDSIYVCRKQPVRAGL